MDKTSLSMTGQYFLGVTDRKQQMTAVKYAKLIKQCLLFLVQYDEKMMQTCMCSEKVFTGWEGTESVNM